MSTIRFHLGTYQTPEEAVEAYDRATAAAFRGEYRTQLSTRVHREWTTTGYNGILELNNKFHAVTTIGRETMTIGIYETKME